MYQMIVYVIPANPRVCAFSLFWDDWSPSWYELTVLWFEHFHLFLHKPNMYSK